MSTTVQLSTLATALDLTLLTEVYQDHIISRGYCCDMLSWAMSRLDSNSCWFTILNSINVIAVASLSGCPCIILTEGVEMDEAVLEKAKTEEICVFSSTQSTFEAAGRLARLMEIS